MPEIRFFETGGVVLTNGRDRNSRHHCVELFGLDDAPSSDCHEFVADDLESGRLSSAPAALGIEIQE